MTTGPINVGNWIEENKQYFLPPVCNKSIHKDGQMKIFCVGGPNVRKDFHIEAGEELFYQIKGDMCLKILEKGRHRDIIIKQGQIFLLPACIPHSPQRFENTIGIVLERARDIEKTELDALRYFVENDNKMTTEVLYEKWFHCTDLEKLGPIIEGYFASEQHKTGKPIPGSLGKPPYELDQDTAVIEPFDLRQWIEENRKDIEFHQYKRMFDEEFQFQVFAYSNLKITDRCDIAETWFWVIEGSCEITTGGVTHKLHQDDSLLVPINEQYRYEGCEGCITLMCFQDGSKGNLRLRNGTN